jgi:ribonuclease HI
MEVQEETQAQQVCGAFLFNDGKFLVDFAGKYLGKTTNKITCHLDSELIVMQLNGAYQVKNQGLKPYHQKVLKEKESFKEIKFVHVLRARNKYADKMVNTVLDIATK